MMRGKRRDREDEEGLSEYHSSCCPQPTSSVPEFGLIVFDAIVAGLLPGARRSPQQ
jgi:hypothetical protein